MNAALRATAALLAFLAILEPSWTVRRNAPLAVEVRADAESATVADEIRSRLRGLDDVIVDAADEARAVVFVGDTADVRRLPAGVPVSVVMRPEGPNVRIAGVTTSSVLMAGWTTTVHVAVEAAGMAGAVSKVALEHQGIELAQVEHRWTVDRETFDARFEYLPVRAGTSTLRVSVERLPREIEPDDNYADVQLAVEDRKFRVLVYEPRPSWAVTFVRRAIEQEPLFDVATLVQPSRGISARTSGAPRTLAAQALEPFDAVVIGSPEELRHADLEALDSYSRTRGGAVILIPDRRPSGSYAKLLPVRGFDEVLLEKPATLEGGTRPLKCSELVVLDEPAPGVDVRAALARGRSQAAVIAAWPSGAGHVVFSGCFDAWRYRGDGEAFGDYWTSRVAEAAAAAPRKLEIVVDPAPVGPNETVRIRARLRHTEFAQATTPIELPSIAGRVTGPGGAVFPLRLWPAAEPGVFEAHLRLSTPGAHVVEVTSGDSYTTSRPLTVIAGARTGASAARESLRTLAAATGGVVVEPDEFARLANQLGRMPRPVLTASVHPTRSPAWALGFLALLSIEWWLRRRQGRV